MAALPPVRIDGLAFEITRPLVTQIYLIPDINVFVIDPCASFLYQLKVPCNLRYLFLKTYLAELKTSRQHSS